MPHLTNSSVLAMNGQATKDSISVSPFSIENIPFGVISTGQNPKRRCATAYEIWAVDLEVLEKSGLFKNVPDLSAGIFSTVDSHSTLST
jgi:hypothetical protein